MEESCTGNIHHLFIRLYSEGVVTQELTDWRIKSIGAILLATKSGAYYVVEPVTGHPSLVSRFSESTPYYGEFRLPSPEIILRKPGNPDQNLEVGRLVNIYGLSRQGTEFDPDSLYTTIALVQIKYLEANS